MIGILVLGWNIILKILNAISNMENTKNAREIKNAVIKSYDIQTKDYSCLVMNLELKIEGGQGACFGGFSLGHSRMKLDKNKPWNVAGYYITRVLTIAGVDSVHDLPGAPIRVIIEDGLVIGIQNFLTEDKFIPREDFKQE